MTDEDVHSHGHAVDLRNWRGGFKARARPEAADPRARPSASSSSTAKPKSSGLTSRLRIRRRPLTAATITFLDQTQAGDKG